MIRSRMAVAAAALCAAAACAGPRAPAPPGAGASPHLDPRYEATATVLDDGSGPELCLGGVLDSLPPQCGGPPIVDWSWAEVDGEERASGVTWGEYHVVGSFDGARFTVEEVGPPEPPPQERDPFATPCPEPAGGWTDVDASKTGERDRIAAMRVAEGFDEYAGIWIDYLGEVTDEFDLPPVVLNVAFTAEPSSFEDALRDVWGGPLCVVRFEHRFRDLRRVQDELSDGGARALGLDVLWSSVDVMRNRVELGTTVIDDERRAALDEAYGAGVVRVVPALRPVDVA